MFEQGKFHEFEGELLPRVSWILEVMMPEKCKECLQKAAARNALRLLENQRRGLERGSAVDQWAKAYLCDRKMLDIDGAYLPFIQRLRGWIDRKRLEWGEAEILTDVLIGDTVRHYAGHPDFLIHDGKRRIVLELKTTRHKPTACAKDRAAMQSLAYANPWEADSAIALHVSPYGIFEAAMERNDRRWQHYAQQWDRAVTTFNRGRFD